MPCKCHAKGCQKPADCGEEYCDDHLITMDDDDITNCDFKDED